VAYSQSGQSLKIQTYGMMVLFRSGILCWCWKTPWTPIWNLYAPWVQWPWSKQSPKIQVCHDGTLTIRKLILNKAQLIISLFVNWLITKKCAPYFRGNTEFPIYFMCPYGPYNQFLNFLSSKFVDLSLNRCPDDGVHILHLCIRSFLVYTHHKSHSQSSD
jgi:hypothetical protein